MATTIKNLELGTWNFEDHVSSLEKSNELLQKESMELRERAGRLKAHSRKFNLCVLGLDRNVEKGNPTAYMTSFFKKVFKGKKFQQSLRWKLRTESG